MAIAKTVIKNHFSPSEKVLSPSGRKAAKQEFKDDADLNSIMRKFQKTGAIDHAKIHQGSYGIASPMQLHEAMNLVKKSESMFNELPSSIRNKFENNAEQFLDYVQNPDNAIEAKELGISLSPEAAKAAEKAASEAGAEQALSAPVGSEGTEPPADQEV